MPGCWSRLAATPLTAQVMTQGSMALEAKPGAWSPGSGPPYYRDSRLGRTRRMSGAGSREARHRPHEGSGS